MVRASRGAIGRPWRAALGAVLAVAFSFIPAAGVGAAAKTPLCEGLAPASPCVLDNEVAAANWFWSSNVKVTSCIPGPEVPEDVPQEIRDRLQVGVCGPVSATQGAFGAGTGFLNPISPGHLGVAMKAGDGDMRTYLRWDVGVIPPGAELQSFVINLKVSQPTPEHIDRHVEASQIPEGKVQTGRRLPATVGDEGAKIKACAVSEPWAGMTLEGGDPPFSVRLDQSLPGPEDLDPSAIDPSAIDPNEIDPDDTIRVTTVNNEPASDCGLNATGRRSPDGSSWRFDITNIAREWIAGSRFNEGIVLMPDADSVLDTWTIEFHGPSLVVRPTVCPVSVPALPPEVPSQITDVTDQGSGQVCDLTEQEGDVVHVSKAEAVSATVEFTGGLLPPPPPPPGIDAPPAAPPPVIPSFGNEVPIIGPPPAVPPTVAQPTAGATPAGFQWGMFPLMALGVGLVASALGSGSTGAAAGLGAGNRVAGVLHRRRLDEVVGG